MAIKKYTTEQEYSAATKSTTESTVSLITAGNQVKVDGINVETSEPKMGDAVYVDGTTIHIIALETLNRTLIPSGWAYKGTVLERVSQDFIAMLYGNEFPSHKYLDVCQYSITAISSTSLTINLRMSPDYSVNTTVNVTLTSAAINATSASEISAAVAAKASAVGDTKAWWAYLADDNDNKVESGGTKIIVQCDTCVDYRYYNVSATGCTIAHTTWGDMPESSWYMKVNGQTTNYRGLMNFAGAASYWGTNGRTPDANVAVGSEAGNTNPMSLNAYNTSEFAAAIRAYYPTYEAYLRGEFGIEYPQLFGCFGLPKAIELSAKYALRTAPTKDGGTKYKHPALAWAAQLTAIIGADGVSYPFYLWGVQEGVQVHEDANLAIINNCQTKANKTTLANSSHRWFAQRYGVNYAWFFIGSNRTLDGGNVYSANQCGAVSLFKYK